MSSEPNLMLDVLRGHIERARLPLTVRADDERRMYVLSWDDGTEEYAAPTSEAIWCHVDMLRLARDFDRD